MVFIETIGNFLLFIIMKKEFELSPALLKELLESDKEAFIAKFNGEFYLSALSIQCIFPLLTDNEVRKEFFLAGELSKEKDGVLEVLNSYFSAFDFLFENKKYELIIQLGHTDGARYLYQKGLKDYLVEYARKHSDNNWAIARAFYEEHAWLLLEGFEIELGRIDDFLAISGVLAIQEKNGYDNKYAMNVVHGSYTRHIGGMVHPAYIYDELKDKRELNSRIEYGDFAAWMDWGGIPDVRALFIWYYKNIREEDFRDNIAQIFAGNESILSALEDPNFPTTLVEIEKTLNS